MTRCISSAVEGSFLHDVAFVSDIAFPLFQAPTPTHPLRFLLNMTFTSNPSLNPQAEVYALHAPIPQQHCVQAWRGTCPTMISYSRHLGLPLHQEPSQETHCLLWDPWHLE